MHDLMQAFELVATGITVTCTGAMLAVLYIVFSPALDEDFKHDPRRNTL